MHCSQRITMCSAYMRTYQHTLTSNTCHEPYSPNLAQVAAFARFFVPCKVQDTVGLFVSPRKRQKCTLLVRAATRQDPNFENICETRGVVVGKGNPNNSRTAHSVFFCSRCEIHSSWWAVRAPIFPRSGEVRQHQGGTHTAHVWPRT